MSASADRPSAVASVSCAPRTYSIAMNIRPLGSAPKSYTDAMFSWLRRAAALASRANRLLRCLSAENSGRSSFSATSRPSGF